jgi:hypothetical protein
MTPVATTFTLGEISGDFLDPETPNDFLMLLWVI